MTTTTTTMTTAATATTKGKTRTSNVQLLGTYIGHKYAVICAVENDDYTIVTGSEDDTFKMRNKTTCECLHTVSLYSTALSLLERKNGLALICGLAVGVVEVRRMTDLIRISTIKLGGSIQDICELEDGTLIAAAKKKLQRWDMMGTMLQTFKGHSKVITKVIELKKDVIVSASIDKSVKMWRVSTGECLHTLTQHKSNVYGLVRLKDGYFASGSRDQTIRVWDENGNCITTYQTECVVAAMTRLGDGSIVVGNGSLIEIRRP